VTNTLTLVLSRRRLCRNLRSWFESLTTNGVPIRQFSYLAARPEPGRTATANYDTVSRGRGEGIAAGLVFRNSKRSKQLYLNQ